MNKEALAIRRVFSLVDMIKNIKFSNCSYVFVIVAVRQQNMHSKHQNTFQSISPFAKQWKLALFTPTPHFTSLYWVPFRPDFELMHCQFSKSKSAQLLSIKVLFISKNYDIISAHAYEIFFKL